MKKYFAVLSALSGLIWFSALPVNAAKTPAKINVTIDISSQSMAVNVGSFRYARWKVSTARAGYWTPRGQFRPTRLNRVYYSKKYDNAPMPNSVFFHGGYAIHGTYHVKYLGRPASHGCIRLSRANSAALFNLVRKYGMGATRITITE